MIVIYMLCIVVHIIYFYVLLHLAHFPRHFPPHLKSCHDFFISYNYTNLYGDVLTFLGVLMYCIVYVLLNCDTCVIMLSYLYLPYYDYGS